MNSVIWVVLGGVAAALVLLLRGGGGERETEAADAAQLVAEGARLVDVRTPDEFSAGHIDGAINVPVQVLQQRLAEVGSPDDAIVVYCRSGNRSRTAKRTLESKGYKNVHDLGAMSNWRAATP